MNRPSHQQSAHDLKFLCPICGTGEGYTIPQRRHWSHVWHISNLGQKRHSFIVVEEGRKKKRKRQVRAVPCTFFRLALRMNSRRDVVSILWQLS